MIAIVNKGGDLNGVCTYTVGINRNVTATFTHDRREGLEVCLRKAADAVKKASENDAIIAAIRYSESLDW